MTELKRQPLYKCLLDVCSQERCALGLLSNSSACEYSGTGIESKKTDDITTYLIVSKIISRYKTHVESTPENFTYDNNGNLTSDGRWAYTWNAENRLVSLETSAGAANAGVKREKYEYTYDWIGNKVESKHYEYEDNAWVLESTNKRYYDGYNLIYETTDYADGRASEVRKYYYGLDLLGGLYGTAGTGGLRMMEIDGALCYVFNNQVGSLENLYSAAGGAQNSSSQVLGSLLAEYTYSAYGDVLMKSEELADKNNVTYSTRYSEGNTGLIYYTYRHYAPRLHKWINKDPIAEQGGINLYQILGNDTVGNWDNFGFSPVCEIYTIIGHGRINNNSIENTSAQDVLNYVNGILNNLGEDPPCVVRFNALACFSNNVNNAIKKINGGKHAINRNFRTNKLLVLNGNISIDIYIQDGKPVHETKQFVPLPSYKDDYESFREEAVKEINLGLNTTKNTCKSLTRCCDTVEWKIVNISGSESANIIINEILKSRNLEWSNTLKCPRKK